ncbi:MAG: L-threonylcarbamoyladenylate synthase [Acidimicrobiaceae bacterium]|jgi:tRNA threonylcarbamoyl adenosine modification protein (Sua5/YciO/YrdC/YwlC family)|nr:L-threonylcarbamoyladenylate synthase [Acidimicrobiaceae bacterium]
MTRVVPADDPAAIEQAAEALAAGEVVGIPTDTVYGLAVDPFRPDAVARVFALKERSTSVALPVLVGGWDQVELIAGTLPVSARFLADRYWPGALTLVVPRREGFTADLGGPDSPPVTVGVRWPAHPVVEALCAVSGPLAVTSANRHGQSPFTAAHQVASAFPQAALGVLSEEGLRSRSEEGGVAAVGIGIVLDGGTCDGIPSTVVECQGPASRCLRDGAIPWSTLYEL